MEIKLLPIRKTFTIVVFVTLFNFCFGNSVKSQGISLLTNQSVANIENADTISVEPSYLIMYPSGISSLQATTGQSNEGTIQWFSTNNDIISVAENGQVTAISAGSASIIAKSNGDSAICNVVVLRESDQVPDESMEFPPRDTTIFVNNTSEFLAAVMKANEAGNVEIVLAPGIYEYDEKYVDWMVWGLGIFQDHVTVRSETGNRDDVIIKGKGMNGNILSIFAVAASDFIVADVTLGWVTTHAVQVKGEEDADNFIAHNVRFVDTYEQMVKGTYNSGATTTSDSGLIEYCLFEYSAKIGPQWYIGGIDCHNTRDWRVKANRFRDIISPEDALAEHAIHFWSDAQNTIAERNIITNCDRGIGFGLGDRGHTGGKIINNMVHTTRDVGIGVENANGVEIYNNTVVSENYPFSIEYRFEGTDAVIKNNLCNASIELRDDATGELSSNLQDVSTEAFVDATNGDLHLNNNFADRNLIVDAGETIEQITTDIDNDTRPTGAAFDIGADEVALATDVSLIESGSDPIIKVYPNPITKGNLNIEFGKAGGPTEIAIYSSTGKLVYQTTTTGEKTVLHRSQLKKGIYLLSVRSGEKVKHTKLIVLGN